MNCYAELVRRLTKGKSANSVSRWASSLKVEGAAGRWSFLYWRKHILALAKHVRRAKDKLRTRKPVLPQPEAVAACVEMQTLDLLDADVIPKSATQVSRHVDKALKQGCRARSKVRLLPPDRASRETYGAGRRAAVPDTGRSQGNRRIDEDRRLNVRDRSR